MGRVVNGKREAVNGRFPPSASSRIHLPSFSKNLFFVKNGLTVYLDYTCFRLLSPIVSGSILLALIGKVLNIGDLSNLHNLTLQDDVGFVYFLQGRKCGNFFLLFTFCFLPFTFPLFAIVKN